jgi:hypothetical protein
MRLRITFDKDRDSGKECLNFDAYIFTQEECDQALKALTICREVLPEKREEKS